jgi:hypothetical protein
MRVNGQNAEHLYRKPPAQERGGLSGHARWLERWTDFFSRQRGRALVLGGSSGLESSLLLGLGFQVTAVDFSAALNEESLQRNPLAEHRVSDIRSLGTALTGRFSIIAANLSLQSFERILIEQVFTTAARFLSPQGIFALRVDGSRLARGSVLSAPATALAQARAADEAVDGKWISALVWQELEHVSIERWSSNGRAGQGSIFEVVGAKSGGDAPDAWPVPHPAVRRRLVEPVQGR